ncbi:MAG: hypothetical protein ABI856_09435 [Nitrospira sp.]
MEQAQIEAKPLTMGELSVMALQYSENPQILIVIEEAMKRRQSDVPQGAI